MRPQGRPPAGRKASSAGQAARLLFGSIVPTAFGPLQTRPKAAALIGALGAPLAYLTAVKLNALGFGVFGDSGPNPAVSLIGIAIVWAGVLPGLLLLSRKIDRVADWAD